MFDAAHADQETTKAALLRAVAFVWNTLCKPLTTDGSDAHPPAAWMLLNTFGVSIPGWRTTTGGEWNASHIPLSGRLLVLPLYDGYGNLCNLQFIDETGVTAFASRLARGSYLPILHAGGMIYTNGSVLCICVDYQSGACIHEATGYPVAVAFTADNLSAVAQRLREKYPHAALVICADATDIEGQDAPYISQCAAREIAQAIGGRVAVPDFAGNRLPQCPGDATFADMQEAATGEPYTRFTARKYSNERACKVAFDCGRVAGFLAIQRSIQGALP